MSKVLKSFEAYSQYYANGLGLRGQQSWCGP